MDIGVEGKFGGREGGVDLIELERTILLELNELQSLLEGLNRSSDRPEDARLIVQMETLRRLAADLPPEAARLRHLLDRRSYARAREYLEAQINGSPEAP